MSTVADMYRKLASIDGEGTARFSEVALRVNDGDATAAKLLLWLLEAMPPESTNQDAMDVIDTAKFWLMFVAATAEKVEQQETP